MSVKVPERDSPFTFVTLERCDCLVTMEKACLVIILVGIFSNIFPGLIVYVIEAYLCAILPYAPVFFATVADSICYVSSPSFPMNVPFLPTAPALFFFKWKKFSAALCFLSSYLVIACWVKSMEFW